ncbi:MAG: hypothetical protein JSS02_23525 [Planctomycetes bacterium]|nr:hypothetical protein [Planctomycetota bacterium]
MNIEMATGEVQWPFCIDWQQTILITTPQRIKIGQRPLHPTGYQAQPMATSEIIDWPHYSIELNGEETPAIEKGRRVTTVRHTWRKHSHAARLPNWTQRASGTAL